MPSSIRRLTAVALAIALASPAVASASLSLGAVSLPSLPKAPVTVPSVPSTRQVLKTVSSALPTIPPSGGVSPPSPGAPTGGQPGAPTGGSGPSDGASTPTPPAKKAKKKRKKKKKAKKPPTTTPDASGDIPANYLALYRAAGAAQAVDWRILAAIGKNESNHGRSMAPGVHSGLNFANCCSGPMQICKVKSCGYTWQAYAVDVNGDGKWSVYDPADAIYAAAHLVHDLQTLFGNHADLLMAAYNAGPGNVMHYHGVPPFAETQGYVTNGLAYIATLNP
jgi:transglycosylase-like protein with SLT domain